MQSRPSRTSTLDQALDAREFVWGLGALAQIHRIPFDAQLVASAYPPPHSVSLFITAAQALGLKCATTEIDANGAGAFATLATGSLVVLAPTATEGTDPAPGSVHSTSSHRLALLINIEADTATIFRAGANEPECVALTALATESAGIAIQAAPEAKPVDDPDSEPTAEPTGFATAPNAATQRKPFGFRWFVPELLKYKRLWRDVLAASLAIQLLGLTTPLITQAVIDKVVVHQTVNTLIVLAVALVVAMLFSQGMTWVRQYLVLHTGNRVDAVLGTRVWEHVLKLPPRYFEHRPTGTLVARLQGIETIRAFVASAAVTLVLDLPFLAIFLAIMFFYSWQLTLIALGFLGVIVALSLAVVPVIRARLNQEFQYGARNQAFVTEYLAGMGTVKSLQMEPTLTRRYGDYLAGYLAAGFRSKSLANTYGTAANTLEQGLTISILAVGAWLVMRNDGFTIGMLVAFQMFSGRLSQPVLRLVGLWQEFQQAHLAVKRLGDIMNAPVEPYSLIPNIATARTDAVEVRIENLAFRYGENLPFLYRNLSLQLAPGKCIALMGASGTGKSTLAKLLQGFYLPTEGAIKLGGRDIRYLAANDLRAHFGVVPQETVLFAGTLYDNLVMANPHASFEQVVAAAKMAGIHDTIEALPQGYHSSIGERGSGLSGGQRQRIAIARALLKRPKVLIFDEATANLDQETAEAFVKTINPLKGKVTILFIAHALPRGLQVDEIVRLDAAGVTSETAPMPVARKERA